jgi:hypothetical protein
VLTPPSIVAAIRAGYQPALHPTARREPQALLAAERRFDTSP